MLDREKDVLYQDMIKEEYKSSGKFQVDVRDFKEGDIVELKDDKYALITSDGEYCNDIDYGEMYKNIKRFKYIDSNTYHTLWLVKKRDEHEKEILKLKKEKYRFDLQIYLNNNRNLLSNKYNSDLYNEFRASKTICKIGDTGVFYRTHEGIKQMVTAGYLTSFYKINIAEDKLLKLECEINIVNNATKSIDVPDFSEMNI